MPTRKKLICRSEIDFNWCGPLSLQNGGVLKYNAVGATRELFDIKYHHRQRLAPMMIPIKRKRLFRANPISRNWHFRTRRHRAVRREEGRQVLRDQNSVDYRCHQEEANRACQKWKKHSATNHSSVRHKHVSWNHFAYIVLVAIPIAHRTLSHITVLVITSIAKHSFLLHPNVLAASRKKFCVCGKITSQSWNCF